MRISYGSSVAHAWRGYVVVVALVCCLVMTACGGDAATTATAAPTTAAVAATTAPVTAAPATAAPATTAPVMTMAAAAPTTAPTAAAPTVAATAVPATAASTAAPAAANTAAPIAATVAPTAIPGPTMAAAAAIATMGTGPTKLTGAPVPLVIYAAHGAAEKEADAFTKATGIPVKIVADSTGPLIAKIQAETNNPQWSMFWADGSEAFAALDQGGQLVRNYRPDVPRNALGTSVIPANGSYIPTGATLMAAMVYDSKVVQNPPTSWDDLLKPEWKGAVGMNNPAISGPTYPFVAGMMQQFGGEDQGKAYFSKLKANGLHVYTTNKVTLTGLGAGEIKLALIQSSAALGAMAKTPTLKIAFLPKVSILPSNIGIDAKRPMQEQTEAKMFAEFVLSPQGQEIMKGADPTGDSLYYPLVTGVEPLANLPPISSVPTQVVDAYVWGAKANEINQWFTENIAQ